MFCGWGTQLIIWSYILNKEQNMKDIKINHLTLIFSFSFFGNGPFVFTLWLILYYLQGQNKRTPHRVEILWSLVQILHQRWNLKCYGCWQFGMAECMGIQFHRRSWKTKRIMQPPELVKSIINLLLIVFCFLCGCDVQKCVMIKDL